MEDYDTITLVIYVIFGLMQLILFFKIWGMTDNVKKIHEKMLGTTGLDLAWEIRKLIIKGEKDKARDLLFDEFFNDLKNKQIQDALTDQTLGELKNDYEIFFQKLGLSLPQEISEINSVQQLYDNFTFKI